MTCQTCKSERIAYISAKCGDLCLTGVEGVGEIEGDVPRDMGIGGGDYVRLHYCLDCGQMQGRWPLEPTELEQGEGES